MSLLELAIFGLALFAALSGLKAIKALMRTGEDTKWEKMPTLFINETLYSEERNTPYDYVDRRGWADLASAQMWGSIAAVSVMMIFGLMLLRAGP